MFWKNTGLVCIVLAAMGIVSYAQTTKPRGHSATLQSSSGYLGVGVQDVTPEIAKALSLPDTGGVLVTYVTDGQAAARAGIHKNDVILEFNGKKVNSDTELSDSIIGKAPGTKVSLVILRGSTKQNLTATLGTRPMDLPLMTPGVPLGIPERIIPDDAPRLGLDVVEMRPQLSAFFGVHEGMLVESVDAGTPAAKAGLKAGDVITRVNGIPVTTAREIVGIVRQSGRKNISFTVVRHKKEMTLSLELAWNRDPFDRGAFN
jgi:serine protease Do